MPAEFTREARAVRPVSERRRARVRIDRRTKLGQRVEQLREQLVAALAPNHGLGSALAAEIAAERLALAEEFRARAIRGEPIALSELSRLEHLADRALRALGLPKVNIGNDPVRSVGEYLATRACP